MLLSLLATYWWVVGIAGVVAAYFVLRRFAKSHVVSFVESYLKTFDASAFAAGQVALPAVIDDTYAAMPLVVKSLLTKTVYAAIVEIVFNRVKAFVASESKSVDVSESAAASTPSTPVVNVATSPAPNGGPNAPVASIGVTASAPSANVPTEPSSASVNTPSN